MTDEVQETEEVQELSVPRSPGYRVYTSVSITADAERPIDVTGTLDDPAREQQMNTYAAGYNTEPFIIEVTADSTTAKVVHCTALIAGEPVLSEPGTQVTIAWGDGTVSDGNEIGEAHTYETPGTYDIDVLLERDGQPSLTRRVSFFASGDTPAPPPGEGEVPTGTVDDVKEWVGDDPDRAQQALDAELDGQNRTTLIDWLEARV